MRKLILSVAVSLDGFIEGPNGEYDWCVAPPPADFKAFFDSIDTIFVGRKTYEMAQQMEGGPDGFPKFKEYIFSTTLRKVKEGATLISDNIKAEVEKIKNEKGKNIWLFGGASLTHSLMSLGLIDEFHLGVSPIILGKGKPLFRDIDKKVPLKLIDSKHYPSGLLMVTYRITKASK